MQAIDYGCGSGILGIATLKLGAAHVTAVDLDPQALLATRDNAIRNGVSEGIDVHGVDAGGAVVGDALRPAYCVLANILAGPLIELAPTLTQACESGGYLVLCIVETRLRGKAAYAAAFDKKSLNAMGACIYAGEALPYTQIQMRDRLVGRRRCCSAAGEARWWKVANCSTPRRVLRRARLRPANRRQSSKRAPTAF
jgi:hypothetical protein